MKSFKSLICILVLPTLFVSCGDTELTGAKVELPVVEISCELSECDLGLSSTFALVYLSESECDQEFDILYSSTSTLSCDADSCSGSTSGNWIDTEGLSVDKVSQTGLFLCAHIDVDGSGPSEFTAGDIIYSRLTVIKGGGTIEAGPDGWSVH